MYVVSTTFSHDGGWGLVSATDGEVTSRWPHPQRIPIIYNMYKQKTQHTNCRRAEVGFSNYLYRFIYFISYNSVLCTRCAVFTIIQTFTPTVQSDCMATGTKCIQRTRHQQTRDPNGIWDASVTVIIIIIIIILIIIIVLRFVYWLPCRSLCSSSHVMGSGRRMHWNEHFQLGGGGGGNYSTGEQSSAKTPGLYRAEV